MFNTKKYQNEITNQFYHEILDHLKSSDGFEQKIILNVTLKFKSDCKINDCGTLSGAVQYKWHNLDYFYHRINRSIAQRSLQAGEIQEDPIMYAFLEPSGHKFSNEIGEIKDLHFHTLWILNANQKESLEDVRNNVLSLVKTNFSSILVQNVEFGENNIQNIWEVLDYNSKFQRLLIVNPKITDSYRIYPK